MRQTALLITGGRLRLFRRYGACSALALLAVSLGTAPPLADHYALVVGVNNYLHTKPLKGAVNDAQQIKRLLVEEFKLPEANVLLLLDRQATRKNIMDALEDVAQRTQPGDVFVVYYSGYRWLVSDKAGAADPNGRFEPVIVPSDAKINPKARATSPNPTFIRYDEINDVLNRMIGRRVFLVQPSLRDWIAMSFHFPSNELLGYYQMSLRDIHTLGLHGRNFANYFESFSKRIAATISRGNRVDGVEMALSGPPAEAGLRHCHSPNVQTPGSGLSAAASSFSLLYDGPALDFHAGA